MRLCFVRSLVATGLSMVPGGDERAWWTFVVWFDPSQTHGTHNTIERYRITLIRVAIVRSVAVVAAIVKTLPLDLET